MSAATLTFPKINTSIELTPELADMIASAVEDYREAKSDESLKSAIESNKNIRAHTDRLRSLHAAGKL